ncbi:MAG: ATPase [Myxococcaceae bacterium]
MTEDIRALEDAVTRESRVTDLITAEVGKVISGQRYTIERILIGLLSDGHVLLEGVPGLAKTMVVRTLAQALSLKFGRIQFTPDLLPSDVIGTTVFDPRQVSFSVRRGPVFANLLLADEINRAPAKVQSALLEAMQERQVTLGEKTNPLPTPFLVLATQNPLEQEGTYPLPEAQLDRFMLKLKVDYPSREEEREMLLRMTAGRLPLANAVATGDDVARARVTSQRVFVDQKIHEYVLDLVRASRRPRERGLADLSKLIEYGASPRASIALVQAARAHAFLRHRAFVSPEDVKAIAPDVLRHRVTLTYEAEADRIAPDSVVSRILEHVAVP